MLAKHLKFELFVLKENYTNVPISLATLTRQLFVLRVIIMDAKENLKREGYYISNSEFALMLGISTSALRSRRRRNKYDGLFKSDGKNYWWKSLRPSQVKEIINDRPNYSSAVRVQRTRRRGITQTNEQTRYPNQAFKNHNDAKMYARITKGKDVGYLNKITDNIIKQTDDNLRKEALKNIQVSNTRNYGSMISARGLKRIDQQQNELRNWKWDQGFKSTSQDTSIRYARPGPAVGYEMTPVDNGSVEIDVDRFRTQSDLNQPTFRNKIEESIYRLKKNKQ